MRLLLWLVALMAAAIGIAVTARFNPGNVVFFYPPHRIDLSLNLFVVLTLLLFVVVYVLARAVRATLDMPAKVAEYRLRKREREANRGLRDALKALFEGRFGHAEKAAMRAAELPENAGLAALIGARAAHRMREPARRDAWLAGTVHDQSLKTARLMTVTELLVDEHRPEGALEAVAELARSLMSPWYGVAGSPDFWQLLNRVQSGCAARMPGIALGYADGSQSVRAVT